MDLDEVPVVDDAGDHGHHVVGLVRRVRDDRVELRRLPVDRVGAAQPRDRLEVVVRQEREQVSGRLDAARLVVRDDVRDAPTAWRGCRRRRARRT
jgi:hypothetical protein